MSAFSIAMKILMKWKPMPGEVGNQASNKLFVLNNLDLFAGNIQTDTMDVKYGTGSRLSRNFSDS